MCVCVCVVLLPCCPSALKNKGITINFYKMQGPTHSDIDYWNVLFIWHSKSYLYRGKMVHLLLVPLDWAARVNITETSLYSLAALV